MSRVGKAPIEIPSNVQVNLVDGVVYVKGGLGELKLHLKSEYVSVVVNGNQIQVSVITDTKHAKQMHGTTRALINNMVLGVSQGFEIKLALVGVGYRAKLDGSKLKLELGFSHDIFVEIPDGVNVTVPTQTEIIVKGKDKHQVGQFAANIRNDYRPPEPYKGKGIRYADEFVAIKETKKKK